MFKGFRDFIMRGNVVDLAVAVAVGAAFNAVVNAFVKDIMTPLISALGGKPDFSGVKFVLNGTTFPVGDALNASISFLITASVIYFFVIVPMNEINRRLIKKEQKALTTKTCKECLSEIPLHAHRCKYCTSIQKEPTL